MTNQLESIESLRKNLEAVMAGPAQSAIAVDWYSRLAPFLEEMSGQGTTGLRDREVLKRLWDDNPVASVGNGTVNIKPAITNNGFVDWFATQAALPLPVDLVEAEAALTALYDQLATRLNELCGRTPILKLNRVLCALFPDHFTTIADVGALRVIYREMGGLQKDHPIHMHLVIRRRIDEALGPLDSAGLAAKVRRMCLPWLLYDHITTRKPAKTIAQGGVAQPSGLSPMPAALRRKGLTGLGGSFQTLLNFLPALDEGLTREEFFDLIHEASPDLAPQSIGIVINIVAREFDLCTRVGDTYRLSARGLNLLESQDPQDLADHLLTSVLGPDHIIKTLAAGPRTKTELVTLLQTVNPGWTSNFAPGVQLTWLRSLGVVEINSQLKHSLTDAGTRWSEMITWVPEFLVKPAETIEELQAIIQDKVQLAAWPDLIQRLRASAGESFCMDENLVKQLHGGLWFHPVRHFAILTGLSGSGKTQLALNYALALCGEQTLSQETVKVIPVQPGWFDPSPLLGYVSPIHQAAYRCASFLALLVRAAENPDRPYVAVLDEMNLSHPEQYLAPILSAMETRGTIDLHHLADGATEIPRSIRYPANLAIVGTINMDETTHGLSDKVLDRAFTLEFWDINIADSPRWGQSTLPAPLRDKVKAVLEALGKVLAPAKMHFGWRTIDDVLGYLAFSAGAGTQDLKSLDDVLYAKVLPKLRGESTKRFEHALQAALDIMKEHGLERCRAKLASMQADLNETGMTRFWR